MKKGSINILFLSLFFGVLKVDAQNLEHSDRDKCREHIEHSICLVHHMDRLGMDMPTPPCLPGGEKYAEKIKQLYDVYSPKIKRMVCSIKNFIVLETPFSNEAAYGLAASDVSLDANNNAYNARIAILKSRLDGSFNLQTAVTLKEQSIFKEKGNAPNPELPQVFLQISPSSYKKLNLLFTFTHELGHLFDYSNHLNRQAITDDCQPYVDCPFLKNTWGALSWISPFQVTSANEFPLREEAANDDVLLEKNQAKLFYDGLLSKSNFLSAYASTNAFDDFADSFAFYILNKEYGMAYVIQTKEGERFDIIAKLNSPLFSTKKDFIESFLSSQNITYPYLKSSVSRGL